MDAESIRNEKLILEHSYTEEIPDLTAGMPRFKNSEKRYLIDSAYDTVLTHLAWYEEKFTKSSKGIIQKKKDFFRELDIAETAIVIGHSLSEVDMDYFTEIDKISNIKNWIFSYHGLSDIKRIEVFAMRYGIEALQITLFKM